MACKLADFRPFPAKAPVEWLAELATGEMNAGRIVQAIRILEGGLAQYPRHPGLSYMRGVCCLKLNEMHKAIGYFSVTLKSEPKNYHARLLIAYATEMVGRFDESLHHYAKIDRTRDPEAVANNYASLLMTLNRHQGALAVLQDMPAGSNPATRDYNLGLLALGRGDWTAGWPLYRNRSALFGGRTPPIDIPVAQTIEDIRGRRLLLFAEQGMGDTMHFVRYAHQLCEIASSLTIEVQKPLVRLVETMALPRPFRVVGVGDDVGQCDVAVPMMDAPGLFGTTPRTVPDICPYFHVPEKMVRKRDLSATDKLRVGVCWAGFPRIGNVPAYWTDQRRSIPFDMMCPLLNLADKLPIQFYSLQLSDHHRPHRHLAKVLDDSLDFLDTATIIHQQQLDLIVSVDTAIAHLAGALNRPVWMLSRFDGCWRWLWDGSTRTGWYPSMTIYRQPAHHSYPAVISAVTKDLAALAGEAPTRES